MTERDIEIVRWLGRHRMATAEQVMRRFDLQRSKAYQRLGVAVDAGLARHEPGIRSPRIYLATPAGLAACDLDLPRASVSPASFEHDAAMVDVATPIELAGFPLLTEREIRRASTCGEYPFRLAPFGAASESQRGAWPDLVVLERADRSLTAIEVELSQKKAERVADKLRAYAVSRYARVQYVCGSSAIARIVEREARRAGADEQLECVLLKSAASTSIVGPSVRQFDDPLSQLETQLREARDRAQQAERRAAAEFDAARRLISEIAFYLSTDRAGRRTTREHWERFIERVEAAEASGALRRP